MTYTCATCNNTENVKSKCSICQTVYYCNRECQIANWATHKVTCTLKDLNPQELTTSIFKKWRKQQTFVRFKDGNITNCAATNLGYVNLKDVMMNNFHWKVDWDMELTTAERQLVSDSQWRQSNKNNFW